MRIGLIADIHGNAPALHAVLSCFKDRVDLIIFLGDIVGYYAFVNECIELIESATIIGIRGNHDEVMRQCIQNGMAPDANYYSRYGSALERARQSLSPKTQLLLQSLPRQRRLMLPSCSIAMFHGAPWDPLAGRVYPDFADWHQFDACLDDIILLGHTHYQMVKQWNNKLIINPGSVGQPRDRLGGACYAELNAASGEVRHYRCTYDPTPIIQDAFFYDPNIPYLGEILTKSQ